MKIAIQAADLDAERIDGTRVYILNMLKFFGLLDQKSSFMIYHRRVFNCELTPPNFSNYKLIQKDFPFNWTQTRFAWELWKEKPDVLWMPMHNIPYLRQKNLKTFVTIHDLAFKYFPDYFTSQDLRRLNFLLDMAVNKSDRLIAISESTKRDILKFYPHIKEDKIKVIHHGFDSELYEKCLPQEEKVAVYSKFKLLNSKYLLYVGALQPRKNLITLISAFEKVKKTHPDLKLVLAGEKAWLWESILEKVDGSPYRKDILITGKVSFRDLGCLMQGAYISVFPSLYEGFGIPVLEAMASDVPVITANNSSLTEVGGDAALYFDANNVCELADRINRLLEDNNLRNELIIKGKEQIKKFSWEKCAKETLEYLRS